LRDTGWDGGGGFTGVTTCDGSGVTERSIVAVCRIEHAAKATSMACANKMCIYTAPLASAVEYA